MTSFHLFSGSDEQILEMIRKGDEKALIMLYTANQKMITAFIRRNRGAPGDAEEYLQEALVVLWERVRSGRFERSAKLSTFLFGTVKNMWARRLAKLRREVPTDLERDDLPNDDLSALDALIEAEEAMIVRRALGKLGEQCRKILLMFYWEEKPMDEIARELGFANAETVKSKKYQCKKNLEQLVRSSW